MSLVSEKSTFWETGWCTVFDEKKTKKMKNLCGKMRKPHEPYEIWSNHRWTWKVLKKYKSDEAEANDPYARWFCFVTSPFCPEGEMGDVYVADIKGSANKIAG